MESREFDNIKEYNKIIHAWDTVISIRAHYVESDGIVADDIVKLERKLEEHVSLIDEIFSTFKEGSVISKVNKGLLSEAEARYKYKEFNEVYDLALRAREVTRGLFQFEQSEGLDFNAIVKGYSAQEMLNIVKDSIRRPVSIMVNAGGDCAIESYKEINVGLTDPDDISKIYQSVAISRGGVSTSGTYIRGAHIKSKDVPFLSASVWGPDPAMADAYATAALLTKDLNLSWLPRDYQYSIVPNPQSRVIYQNP